jgi:DAACS family dicarboxylate/amino acid:cation (Na+ or H+) symporter
VWGILLGWLVRMVPVAVFCVTARTVGEYGFAPFAGLAWYVGLAVSGLMLHIVLVYPIWVRCVAGFSLRTFISHAKHPAVYAFGTNSSLATLPVTLGELDAMGVPKSASRLGACIGTNLNNDGILLYEAMAVLFVAQAYGIEMSVGQQVTAALVSLVAAIGVAGIPEAGVVSLSLVLTAVGLPLEIVPILLTVDWIIARVRSITNVLSDMTVSIGVSALEGTLASTLLGQKPASHPL